jgi:hypothetical protein
MRRVLVYSPVNSMAHPPAVWVGGVVVLVYLVDLERTTRRVDGVVENLFLQSLFLLCLPDLQGASGLSRYGVVPSRLPRCRIDESGLALLDLRTLSGQVGQVDVLVAARGEGERLLGTRFPYLPLVLL